MTYSALVIDRDKELVGSIADILRMDGAQVREAWRPEHIPAALAEGMPDIVICHPAAATAAEDTSALVALLGRPDLAVVIITGRAFFDLPLIPTHALLLEKPFGRAQLRRAVADALRRLAP